MSGPVSDPTEAITQELREHVGKRHVGSGKVFRQDGPGGLTHGVFDTWDDQAAHVASAVVGVLTANGWATVKLTEPDSERYEGDEHEPVDRKAWKAGHDFEASVWHPGEVQLSVYMDVWEAFEPFSAADARALAAALLAAAEEAERDV